ncbi:hypothetical protein D210916BOD24_11950 [Alteromonas sp. D210916BOD_24]
MMTPCLDAYISRNNVQKHRSHGDNLHINTGNLLAYDKNILLIIFHLFLIFGIEREGHPRAYRIASR